MPFLWMVWVPGYISLLLSRICAQPGGNADKEGSPRDPCRFCHRENGGKSPWDGGPLINLWYTSFGAPPEGTSIFPMILLLLLLLLELIERSWKLQSLKVLQDGLEEEDSRLGGCLQIFASACRGGRVVAQGVAGGTGSLKKGIRECPPKRENFRCLDQVRI